jgi:predicted acyltransferase
LYMIPAGDRSLQEWFYKSFFGSFASPINASLLFALFFMLMNWAVGYVLDKRKIYIRV